MVFSAVSWEKGNAGELNFRLPHSQVEMPDTHTTCVSDTLPYFHLVSHQRQALSCSIVHILFFPFQLFPFCIFVNELTRYKVKRQRTHTSSTNHVMSVTAAVVDPAVWHHVEGNQHKNVTLWN